MTPHYRQSFVAALTGHLVLIVAVVMLSVLPGCRHPKPVDLSSFDNVDITQIDTTKPPSRTKPPPENPAPPLPPPPAEVRDPGMPVDPVLLRPPDKQPPKPAEKPDPDGMHMDRTPPHDVKPANTNTATAPVPVIISGVRTIRIVPGTGPHRSVMRPLTARELDPLGRLDAPLGASNSVPMDERQRCLLLIKRALYDVWERPTMADAGHQPAWLEIRFDLSGRVVSAIVSRSSGSEIMDRSVMAAAKSVTRVDGLTPGFIKEFPKLPIEFEITE